MFQIETLKQEETVNTSGEIRVRILEKRQNQQQNFGYLELSKFRRKKHNHRFPKPNFVDDQKNRSWHLDTLMPEGKSLACRNGKK